MLFTLRRRPQLILLEGSPPHMALVFNPLSISAAAASGTFQRGIKRHTIAFFAVFPRPFEIATADFSMMNAIGERERERSDHMNVTQEEKKKKNSFPRFVNLSSSSALLLSGRHNRAVFTGFLLLLLLLLLFLSRNVAANDGLLLYFCRSS